MAKLLHIAFNAHEAPPKFEDLRAIYDKALDWVSYAPNCCIVFTSSEPDVWYHRLKPVLRDGDSFLIHEIYIAGDRFFTGYLPKFVWDWLAKYVDSKPVPLSSTVAQLEHDPPLK